MALYCTINNKRLNLQLNLLLFLLWISFPIFRLRSLAIPFCFRLFLRFSRSRRYFSCSSSSSSCTRERVFSKNAILSRSIYISSYKSIFWLSRTAFSSVISAIYCWIRSAFHVTSSIFFSSLVDLVSSS